MDPNALLTACKEVMAEATVGTFKAGRYEFRGPPVSPEVSRFPKAIRDLGCTRVVIHEEGHVTIEMGDGFSGFGVKAYPKNFKEPYSGFQRGDRKIIEDLWYYDDEYIDNPGYDKEVDKWMRKNRRINER